MLTSLLGAPGATQTGLASAELLCPIPGDETAACITLTSQIAGINPQILPDTLVEAGVLIHRYAFEIPTGGTLHAACAIIVFQGDQTDPCALAGGAKGECLLIDMDGCVPRELVLSDIDAANPDLLDIWNAELDLLVGGLGVTDVPIVVVWSPVG